MNQTAHPWSLAVQPSSNSWQVWWVFSLSYPSQLANKCVHNFVDIWSVTVVNGHYAHILKLPCKLSLRTYKLVFVFYCIFNVLLCSTKFTVFWHSEYISFRMSVEHMETNKRQAVKIRWMCHSDMLTILQCPLCFGIMSVHWISVLMYNEFVLCLKDN